MHPQDASPSSQSGGLNLPPMRFTRMLMQANALDQNDLGSWLFHPGMLYGDGRSAEKIADLLPTGDA